MGVVHVDIGRLDRLVDLAGELLMARTSLQEACERARVRHGFAESVLDLTDAVEKIGRQSDDLHRRVIRVRLIGLGRALERFHGLVEALARRTGKEIGLSVAGAATEVDRKIIDRLAEPLLHLVRNAADHGIELPEDRARAGKDRRGRIAIEAARCANGLRVSVADDGRGIDPAVIRDRAVERGFLSREAAGALAPVALQEILFHPDFSTAADVTDLSGRGVGLHAARRAVEALGGTLALQSEPGRGCRFTVDLPLDVAVVDAMEVLLGDEAFAVALQPVREVVLVARAGVRRVEGQETIDVRGQAVTLVDLRRRLGVAGTPPEGFAVVLVDGDAPVGLAVDRVLRWRGMVVKPLPRLLGSVPGLAGACVDGRGSVVPLLDVQAIVRLAAGDAEARDA